MKIKTLLSIALLAICWSSAFADDTDISSLENVVYIESGASVTIESDGSAVIPINMKNSVAATGYQFNLYLPEGMSADDVTIAKSNTRKDSEVSFSKATQADGSIKVVAYTSDGLTFSDNDGEVATITISEAVAGSYTFKVTESVITYSGSTVTGSDVVSTVNVKEATYEDGYSVGIAPFEFNEDAEASFIMNNDADITNVAFDVEIPSAWIDGELYYVDAQLAKTKFTTSDELNGKTIHVTIDKKSSNKIASGTETEIATLGLAFDESIAAGIYPINIKNIQMTDAEGVDHSVAPTTSYIKVGTPTNASLDLNGLVIKEVSAALATESSITSLDMSKVLSVKGTLTLKDGVEVVLPSKSAKAEKVEYTRAMTNSWGTICLPFELTSNSNVQYYQLKEVTSEKMTFEPVSSVSAYTPAVFKKLSGESVSMSAEDATIAAGSKSVEFDGNWIMKGTMTSITLDPTLVDFDIYYIASDKFWYADKAFAVAAYRGWFETINSLGVKAMSFDIEDSEATNIKYVENADGTVDAIYDISGRKLNKETKGVNIINGKKVIVK